MSTPLHLILLAGGQGKRAGGVPKQFRNTGRGALFAVSLRTFLAPSDRTDEGWHVASVTVTAPEAWHEQVQTELGQLEVPTFVATPGTTRTGSTWQATSVLQDALGPQADDLVAVHDAARPFASRGLLGALAEAALVSGVAVPGLPVPDTIIAAENGQTRYLSRETLVAVQTPQVMRWSLFAAAHRWAQDSGSDFTDDGGLLSARGHPATVVPGEAENWKVTTAADWARAEDILRQ